MTYYNNIILYIKIQIEDYFGNDLCSFDVDDSVDRLPLKLVNCNIADIDEDETGEPYVRVQLETQTS